MSTRNIVSVPLRGRGCETFHHIPLYIKHLEVSVPLRGRGCETNKTTG